MTIVHYALVSEETIQLSVLMIHDVSAHDDGVGGAWIGIET